MGQAVAIIGAGGIGVACERGEAGQRVREAVAGRGWGCAPGGTTVWGRAAGAPFTDSAPPEGGGGGQQPAHPRYANYWAPLTRKRRIPPHPAQPRHTDYWAPRTRKRHQQEHRPQRPTERSDPTQHAKGRTGDRPGPRKGATTRQNVTQGGGPTPRPSPPLPPPPPPIPGPIFSLGLRPINTFLWHLRR